MKKPTKQEVFYKNTSLNNFCESLYGQICSLNLFELLAQPLKTPSRNPDNSLSNLWFRLYCDISDHNGPYNYSKALSVFNFYNKNRRSAHALLNNLAKKTAPIQLSNPAPVSDQSYMDTNEDNNTIIIDLSNVRLLDYVGDKNNPLRSRLGYSFAELVNQKLQATDFNGYLVLRNNHFNKKKENKFWVGEFHCSAPSCNNRIRGFIREKIVDFNAYTLIKLSLVLSKQCLHERYTKKRRIAGKERENLQYKLQALGVQRVRDEHILSNYEFQSDCEELSKIKPLSVTKHY